MHRDNNWEILYFFSHELLTVKFYGRKVLLYMRTRKRKQAMHNFAAQSDIEASALEGALIISQWGHMDLEEMPSLTQIQRSLDKIIERVTELINACSLKSPSRTITFVQQVLYEEMGFQGIGNEDDSFDHIYIDRVKKDNLVFYILMLDYDNNRLSILFRSSKPKEVLNFRSA